LFELIGQKHGITTRLDPNSLLNFFRISEIALLRGDETRADVIARLTQTSAPGPHSPESQLNQMPASAADLQGQIITLVDNPQQPSSGETPPETKSETAPSNTSSANPATPQESESATKLHLTARLHELFLKTEISADVIRGEKLSVEDVLRLAVAQLANPVDLMMEEAVLPASPTLAFDWDLLLTPSGVVVTSRLACNLHKETRVYKVSDIEGVTPEEIQGVIIKTIRPWSWRSQVEELVGQITMNLPSTAQLPALPALAMGISSSVEPGTQPSASVVPTSGLDANTINALGSFLSSGSIALIQTAISALQVAHHAEPPTASIEVLPGMLVVMQSQAAHREIADLIDQIRTAAAKSP
jgi:hypothetical protein